MRRRTFSDDRKVVTPVESLGTMGGDTGITQKYVHFADIASAQGQANTRRALTAVLEAKAEAMQKT
jgi:hypothetical protein